MRHKVTDNLLADDDASLGDMDTASSFFDPGVAGPVNASSQSISAQLASETITHSGSGLVFINSYGSGVSTTFQNEIVAAETYLESNFTDACTIRCNFNLQSLSPSFSAENSFGTVNVTYAQYVNALQAHATSADDQAAVASLKNLSDPSHGALFEIPTATARMLGLTNSAPSVDDSVILNSYYWTAAALQNNPNDAIGVILHEVTEGAMGRIGSLGIDDPPYWAPMDLFRFTASGQRDFTGGSDGVPTYFSTNGATVATGLQYHNSVNGSGTFDGFDLADWDQVGADSSATDPFGPGGPGAGDPGTLSLVDLQIMDVLGWTRTGSAPQPPVVTASNQTLASGTPVAASSLFSVTDSAGHAMTEYGLYDNSSAANSGHFVVNGVVQSALQDIFLTPAQFAQTTFVPGSSGSTDDLFVNAFDGTAWGAPSWTEFQITASSPQTPVVTASNQSLASGTPVAASSLFSVTDPAGHAITEYGLYDNSPAANSGNFVVNGVVQSALQDIFLTPAQLAQTTFVPGSSGSTDDLFVNAFDGTKWGAPSWTEFHVNAV